MRIPSILFTFCIFAISCGHATQNSGRLKIAELPITSNGIKHDEFSIDTFRLGEFIAKKVIAYKFTTATIDVDYDDYLKSLEVFWKRYKNGMIELKKEAGDEYADSMYASRWHVIDSVYQAIRKLSKEEDTIHLNHAVFKRIGLRSLMDFDVVIEKGNCVIYDDKGVRQTIIIRQKLTLSGWGGRRYFLPGSSTYFYETTDWIS